MKNSYSKFLNRSIYIIFTFIALFLVLLNVFKSAGYNSLSIEEPPYFNLVTLIVALLLVGLVYRFGNSVVSILNKVSSPFMAISLLLLSVLFQIFVIRYFNVDPHWDFGELIR